MAKKKRAAKPLNPLEREALKLFREREQMYGVRAAAEKRIEAINNRLKEIVAAEKASNDSSESPT